MVHHETNDIWCILYGWIFPCTFLTRVLLLGCLDVMPFFCPFLCFWRDLCCCAANLFYTFKTYLQTWFYFVLPVDDVYSSHDIWRIELTYFNNKTGQKFMFLPDSWFNVLLFSVFNWFKLLNFFQRKFLITDRNSVSKRQKKLVHSHLTAKFNEEWTYSCLRCL